jgi:uncharacterized membrane protein
MLTYRVARGGGLGAVLLAIGLIALGTYYLLKNAFGIDLPDLDEQVILPIVAIGIGIVILAGAWERRQVPR